MSAVTHVERLHRAIHELRLVSIITKWMKNSFMRNTNYYLLQLSGRQRTFLANYTFSAESCLFKFCVYSLSSYLVTTGEPYFFHNQHPSGFLFLQCCMVTWSCVLVFGWRSQLDLWEGWVSYCLSCYVLMECRNLYASFHSSFIAIDFWLSPLPVLKGDVAAEKMSVSQ